MPKRSREDKIDKLKRKLRKLEDKKLREQEERKQESENKINSDPLEEPPTVVLLEPDPPVNNEPNLPISDEIDPPKTDEEVVDLDLLNALGDQPNEGPNYGEPIHENLSLRWGPILRKGLKKEDKEALFKDYKIPSNCTLLGAPKLNVEIESAVNEMQAKRDAKICSVQHSIGIGLTAVNRAMDILLRKGDPVQSIKILGDSCRILSEVHFKQTKARQKLLSSGLDKKFLDVTKDIERDDFLFSKDLGEKIKATKVAQQQGLQIKRPQKPSSAQSSARPSTSQPQPRQGNWNGPPRPRSVVGNIRRGGPQRGKPQQFQRQPQYQPRYPNAQR